MDDQQPAEAPVVIGEGRWPASVEDSTRPFGEYPGRLDGPGTEGFPAVPGNPADTEDVDAYRDWRWVEEWRAQGERPAWAPGIAVALFIAILVAVALLVLTSGLRDTPWLAIVVNVVIAIGMAPALWLSRGLPVLRFLAAGAAAGLVAGWIWMLLSFPG
jgi:hypothetical protein